MPEDVDGTSWPRIFEGATGAASAVDRTVFFPRGSVGLFFKRGSSGVVMTSGPSSSVENSAASSSDTLFAGASKNVLYYVELPIQKYGLRN